ncbi:MAG: TIGR03364 family FAD-dependent oxidoreductase, partial [Nocardioidaceae bacterium]
AWEGSIMNAEAHAETIVVGAGIVGLAHALVAAEQGHTVTVIERDERAVGASVRNFGSIWPIGQFHAGDPVDFERGRRGADVWRRVARDTGMWINDTGSLHLAYEADELAVLEELVSRTPELAEAGARIVTADEVAQLSPAVRAEGLIGGLHSPTELNVDPTIAIPLVAQWLQERHGVRFVWGTLVRDISMPQVHTSSGTFTCERIVVCSGSDFQTLYPDVFPPERIRRCKLQMLRTVAQPSGYGLGPTLCTSLTFLHYDSFKHLDSLSALRQRLDAEFPLQREHGIHVLVTQTASGQITIGDSHSYDMTPDPFENQRVFDAILEYFDRFVSIPRRQVAEVWHGVYPSLRDGRPHLVAEPEPGVHIANGLGGAGMTLSFGLAHDHLAGLLHPDPAVGSSHGDVCAAPSRA